MLSAADGLHFSASARRLLNAKKESSVTALACKYSYAQRTEAISFVMKKARNVWSRHRKAVPYWSIDCSGAFEEAICFCSLAVALGDVIAHNSSNFIYVTSS